MAANIATKDAANKLDIKYYIHSAIVFILMFGFPHLPLIEPLTPYGMQVVGIFLGCIYGWTVIDVVWPSLLGLVALGFTEFGGMKVAFKEAYGGDTFLFVFFMLSFAALVTKAGVTDYMAKWVISRKFAKGRPWIIALLVYSAAYIVGALVSVMPSIVICWTLTYQLCKSFGYTNKDLYPKLMIIGVVNAALMGHSVFPFKALAVMMLKVLNTQLGINVNFAVFTLFGFVLGFGSVILYLLICKYIYKPDVKPIISSSYVYENEEKLNTYQKQVIGLLVAMVMLLFIPGFLPAGPVKAFFSSLGNTGIVVVLLMLCGLIKMRSGSSFADIADLIKAGVPWATMILLATAMVLAAAISSDDTGVKAFFQAYLNPVLAGHGTVIFFGLLLLATIALTNVVNNVVVGLVMVPIICSVSVQLGFPPEILTVALCLALNITFILPSGSPIAAFLHGNSEWLSSIEIQKYAAIPLVVITAWFILVSLTLGNLLW